MLLSTQTGGAMRRFGFEKGALILHGAGYDCLDYSLFDMIADGDEWNAPGWEALAESRRAFADANGIVFNQAHAPFGFNWANETIKKEKADPRVERSIKIAAMLGASSIIVHPLHWFPFKGHEEEIRKINLEYYRSLIPVARDCGIRIAFENMWQKEVKRKCISDDVGSRAADLASYIDEIDSEWVVACLDVGHCSLVGEEAEDAIRVLGHDRLKALHVHDNDYQGDRHTLPGLGMMNWDNIMQALADIDYTGEFTYEADGFLRYFDNGYIPQACKFMEQTGRYLIAKYDKARAKA